MNSHNLYASRRFRSGRKLYLEKNPLCVDHLKFDIVKPAVILDHIEPHRFDQAATGEERNAALKRFWDVHNWQGLCKFCHDKKTGRGE